MANKPSAPVMNPIEQSGADYLQTHRIPDLFHNLSAALVYNKPDDPKAFMIDFLEQLKKARLAGLASPSLVQDNDLLSIFRMLDPAGHGHITYSQYASTMEALGVSNYNASPAGKDNDRITFEIFSQEARKRLNELNATYRAQ
ncbi:hypothetical protein I4U23_019196 [Adineta vaga]|nr:hypothetical protein I4U23_019196 [Adineta vaga]